MPGASPRFARTTPRPLPRRFNSISLELAIRSCDCRRMAWVHRSAAELRLSRQIRGEDANECERRFVVLNPKLGHTLLTWDVFAHPENIETGIRDIAELGFDGTETGGGLYDW